MNRLGCRISFDTLLLSAGVHDTVVNQLLTKIDGVDALNNILLIGMTNRKDMLDEALLRPGRLEVQIEIGLPDEGGRVQILTVSLMLQSTAAEPFCAHILYRILLCKVVAAALAICSWLNQHGMRGYVIMPMSCSAGLSVLQRAVAAYCNDDGC